MIDGTEPVNGLLGHSYELASGAETLTHYETWADTYDREINEDLGYAQPTRCAAALAEVTGSRGGVFGGHVLDVGCGTGLSGIALRDAGFINQDGCDFSPSMLKRAAETDIYQRLFIADLNEGLGTADETYDAAAAVGVFSFGHIQPSALRKILRVVRPDSAVVIGLNDHFWELGTLAAELHAIETEGVAEIAFQEHGDHLPGAGIGGWVIVLVRAST
ncbi:MAG: methyltransferase domain-containing protein [Acidimicrobiales bacterium]|nr:methyltransferase domain-containing protein [Acidimicrobiales bacterium]